MSAPVTRVLGAIAMVCVAVTPVAGQGAATAGTAADKAPGRTDDERGRLELSLGDDLRVSLGGYLQVDGRWSSGPQSRAPDGMLLRRARLVFDAARPDGWHVRLQPDFGQGRVLIQDAFVGWRGATVAVRAGRFRPAFGTERMQSSSTLLFPERSIVNTLMPSRSMGVQVTGERRQVNMAIGAFRTPISTDVQVIDTDGDVGARTGVGHDLLARVGWRMVHRRRYLDAQAGLLAGHEQGTAETPAIPRVLSVGQLPIAAVRNDAGRVVIADGARHRRCVSMRARPESALRCAPRHSRGAVPCCSEAHAR
jgi:phosphate-selective porin OprO/OprP